MNNLKAGLAAMVLTLISTAAYAGKEAHGGNTVICRNTNGKISSVQLLDFYEGEALFGLTIPKKPASYLVQARQVASNLESVVGNRHRQLVERVIANLRFLPKGVRLKVVDDSDDILIPPKSCSVEQTALFTDDGLIHIVSDYWSLMSETDKAGLILHEALYSFMRMYSGATDSVRSRKINAYAFSGFPFVKIADGTGASWTCSGSDGSRFVKFYATQSPAGLSFDFAFLPDGLVYSKTTTTAHPDVDLPTGNPSGPKGPLGCRFLQVNSNFENDKAILFCHYQTTVNGVTTDRHTVEVAPLSTPNDRASFPYSCQPRSDRN